MLKYQFFEDEIGVTGNGNSHTAPQQFGACYYGKREMTRNLPIVEKLVLQDIIKLFLVKMNASGDNFKDG